jgi:Uma2 family endonuclease
MIRPLELAPPGVGDPDSLYEVVFGRKVVKPMGTYENVLAGLLFNTLCNHVAAHGLGRAVIDVLFDLPTVENDRRPAVAFVSFTRWPANRRPPSVNAWPMVPELAAEVVSPTDHLVDVIEKVDEYFRAGVGMVWLVLPRQERVYTYTSPTSLRILSRGDDLTADPVVPGFRVRLADLFPPPDEPAS